MDDAPLRTNPTGRIAAPDAARYLSGKLGRPVEIESLKQTYPGFSRQTWLVQARVGGEPQGLVIRLDPPWGASVPTSLKHEWSVYQRLWGTAVPVAEPLWYDEGQDFAEGRALMVRRMVEGGSTIPGLTEPTAAGAALRRQVVEEHVGKLAALHGLDWKALGFGGFIAAPPSAAEALRFEYDWWVRDWADRRSEPFPLVTEFLCWLGEHIPSDTPRVSIVKGNNGVGEEIFRDGRLVAMSDFELASLGDGVLDLAFSQGTLDLIPYADAVRLYEQATGTTVSPERLAFATLWIRFKSLANVNGYAFYGLRNHGDFRTTCAALGLVMSKGVQNTLAACIGKDLLSASQLLAPRGSSYASLAR